MLDAGVSAVDWHIRPTSLNAPFQITARGIRPLPELYGLIIFAQVFGDATTLLNTSLTAPPTFAISAWAVTHRNRTITVLLINKGSTAGTVNVPAGFGAPARPSRLRAPRPGSLNGVTLAGQRIGADARWRGRKVTGTLNAKHGVYRVGVPPWSAVTVTFHRRS